MTVHGPPSTSLGTRRSAYKFVSFYLGDFSFILYGGAEFLLLASILLISFVLDL